MAEDEEPQSTEPKPRRRSSAVKEDTSEVVLASELSVGDLLHFPNSRGAQAIESIVDEAGNRAITTGDTTWNVPSDFEVRREQVQ